MSKEPHTHEFKEIKLLRIFQVQKKYKGTTGDKAFLVRVCACGVDKAFEYGNYPNMVKLGKKLKDAKDAAGENRVILPNKIDVGLDAMTHSKAF